VWGVGCGVWGVEGGVCVLWFVVCGLWFVVGGLLSTVEKRGVPASGTLREREFFIDNLLVRVHHID